jgi:hypothetical protein
MAFDRVETTSVGLDRKARDQKQRAIDEECESRSSVDSWRFTDHTPLHPDEIGVLLRIAPEREAGRGVTS